MKHLIMGTAGHVDHGKTALIKALTNIDCDTHKEEKRRGITINLGFAHLDLPTGNSVGIVDVPGHKDFVHTMVGGTSGIDFVLMVIAADCGVMPQTREHLQIMKVLGVKHGLIALTKIDLVDDPELLELSRADIRELTAGTFLENSPIVHVSIKTGEGLEILKKEISRIINRIEERPAGGVFRIFADRIFSISGFGAVVTGSVVSGCLNVKDRVYLLPGGKKELMVRRLERHGKEVPRVMAGDRASINLVGLDRADFKKGMIISDRILKDTKMLDAKLELFESSPAFGIWSQVTFFTGTYEKPAKIHLIDKNKMDAGETGLVQVHLQEPCVLSHGDRFVIRTSSNDMTLGGGEVIDIAPLVHRRRPGKLVTKMTALARGKLPELISNEVRKLFRAVNTKEIAFNLNVSTREVEECAKKKLAKDIVKYDVKDGMIFITGERLQNLRQGIVNAIKEFKKQNPLIDRGANLNEIRGALKFAKGSADEEVLKIVLEHQAQTGKLMEKNKTWMLADGMAALDKKMADHLNFFSNYLKSFEMKTPLMSQIINEAEKRNLSPRELKQVLYKLVSTGKVYRVNDDYIHADIVDNCREKLKKELPNRKNGITVAEFRDLVGGNRKICLLLLAQYDSEMLTQRFGDVRVLKQD
ncbi:MAG: selenocysteine-specific translation elongation factor [Candidatus Aminicenantes bacterium]|nr:MAG: selenocysteine-specific translation elongation factor [Candidatus Aminicenantes bacterium]